MRKPWTSAAHAYQIEQAELEELVNIRRIFSSCDNEEPEYDSHEQDDNEGDLDMSAR